MYIEAKKRFVDECYPNSESSRRWILFSLSLFSEYEREWGMDFTMQSYEVLQRAFDSVGMPTYNGAHTVIIRLQRYAKWRIKNGLPCTDAVFRLVPNPMAAIRNTMVASPSALKEVIDDVFDPPELRTVDIIYKVFLWMGFSGLPDTEAVNVTSDEVDLDAMHIRHFGVEYHIYEGSQPDFNAACNLKWFMERRGLFRRAEGDEIMRGKWNIRAQPMSVTLKRTIRPTLTRRMKYAAMRNNSSNNPKPLAFGLTFSKVFASGLFYRMYLDEQAGHPPDFEAYAISEFEHAQRSDKPYKISEGNPRSTIILRLRTAAQTDYENWKQAFNL